MCLHLRRPLGLGRHSVPKGPEVWWQRRLARSGGRGAQPVLPARSADPQTPFYEIAFRQPNVGEDLVRAFERQLGVAQATATVELVMSLGVEDLRLTLYNMQVYDPGANAYRVSSPAERAALSLAVHDAARHCGCSAPEGLALARREAVDIGVRPGAQVIDQGSNNDMQVMPGTQVRELYTSFDQINGGKPLDHTGGGKRSFSSSPPRCGSEGSS